MLNITVDNMGSGILREECDLEKFRCSVNGSLGKAVLDYPHRQENWRLLPPSWCGINMMEEMLWKEHPYTLKYMERRLQLLKKLGESIR